LFPASIGRTGKLSRRPLVRTDAADMLKPPFKQAGLPAHYSPHSFRATGITNFLENDGALEAAQRIAAGHADSRTTKLYDRRGQEDFIPATWGGINTLATSGQGFNEVSGVDNTKVLEPWLDANIRSKGPLGAAYPPIQFLMEGDTPSWFSLVNNGLDSYRNPSWGGWGVDTNGEYFTESHGPFGPKGLPA
jgi:cellulose-binding protein